MKDLVLLVVLVLVSSTFTVVGINWLFGVDLGTAKGVFLALGVFLIHLTAMIKICIEGGH